MTPSLAGRHPVRALVRARAAAVRTAFPSEWAYVVRIAAAAAVGWQLCVWLGAHQPPVYAVIVPLVAMRNDPSATVAVSAGRLVGVVAGLTIGILVLAWLRPSSVAVGVVMVLALAVGMVLRAGGALNLQVAVSALLVFANTDPSAYAVSRLWETAVGAVVTLAFAVLLFPPNPVRAFLSALQDVADASARNLLLAADLLVLDGGAAGSAPRDDLVDRLTAGAAATDEQARLLPARLAAARGAVRLNPVWRRRPAGDLVALEPVVAVAPEVTDLIRTHVIDVVEMSGRADLRCGGPLRATAAGPSSSRWRPLSPRSWPGSPIPPTWTPPGRHCSPTPTPSAAASPPCCAGRCDGWSRCWSRSSPPTAGRRRHLGCPRRPARRCAPS